MVKIFNPNRPTGAKIFTQVLALTSTGTPVQFTSDSIPIVSMELTVVGGRLAYGGDSTIDISAGLEKGTIAFVGNVYQPAIGNLNELYVVGSACTANVTYFC